MNAFTVLKEYICKLRKFKILEMLKEIYTDYTVQDYI